MPEKDLPPEEMERPRETSGRDPLTARQVAMLVNQGAHLLEAGRAQEALPFLEEAYRTAPEAVAVCINLGGAYILLGRYREAVPVLESAAEREPANPMIWVNLAAAYLGNPVLATPAQQERAIGALLRSVDLNPATPNAYYNLGLIYKDRGEWDQAAEAFAWAVKVNPLDRDARAWWKRAKAMREANARGEAP
ncbi:MAG: tetratricopeptide repeat protein [Anaerolineae bacterium]